MSSHVEDAPSYSALVSKVLSVEPLAARVKQFASRKSFLNLVSSDWQTRLTNHALYQRYNNRAGSCFRPSKYQQSGKDADRQLIRMNAFDQDAFRVIVAVNCRIEENGESLAIYTADQSLCAPLSMIMKAMTKDLEVELVPSIKFYMNNCNPIRCQHCFKGRESYLLQNYKLESNQPCVAYTMLFDGTSVKNVFGSVLKDCFSKTSLLAVVAVTLNSRSLFNRRGDRKRVVSVGGSLERIVTFDERHLEAEEEIPIDVSFIGTLTKMAEEKKPPVDSSEQSFEQHVFYDPDSVNMKNDDDRRDDSSIEMENVFKLDAPETGGKTTFDVDFLSLDDCFNLDSNKRNGGNSCETNEESTTRKRSIEDDDDEEEIIGAIPAKLAKYETDNKELEGLNVEEENFYFE